jgi:hypothetical protein
MGFLVSNIETAVKCKRPHTRTVLPSVSTAQSKLCQVCSVWPARGFITHAQLDLKNIDQFSLQFRWVQNISMMLALSELLCYPAIAVVLDRKCRGNARKSSHATWCWQRYKYKRNELRPWGHNIHYSPTWTAQLSLLPFRKLHSPEILTAHTYGISNTLSI